MLKRFLAGLLVVIMSVQAEVVSRQFTPKDIQGCQVWLDASDASSVVTSGGNIVSIADKSGNGANFTQSVEANRPFYSTGINGLNVMTFTNDPLRRLECVKPVVFKSVFMTTEIINHNGSDGLWGVTGGDFGIRIADSLYFNGSIEAVGNNGDFTYGGTLKINGIETGAYTKGVPYVLSAYNVNPSFSFALWTSIGQYFSIADRAYTGQIGEFVAYDRVLSNQEIVKIESYLANKWAIPVAKTNNFNLSSGIILNAGTKPVYDGLTTNGLAALWKLDEQVWNGTAGEVKDSSLNANNGTSDGAISNPAKINRGGFFNGSNMIEVPSSDSLKIGHGTWAAWIYPTSFIDHPYHTVIGKSYESAYWFGLYLNSGKLQLWVGASPHQSTGEVLLNQWSHIAATWDGSVIRYYINGIFDSQNDGVTDPPVLNDQNMIIGGDANTVDYRFTGKIDDVRLYNQALSSNEVAQLANAELLNKKPSAVYQGSQLVFNPNKKSYTKTVTWSPLMIPDCQVLLNADNLTVGEITIWTDQSTNSFIFSEPGGVTKHPVVRSGLNSRKVVHFGDSSSDYCSLRIVPPVGLFPNVTGEATLFVVATILAGSAGHYDLVSDEDDGWWRFYGDGQNYPSLFIQDRLNNYCIMPETGSYAFEILASQTSYRMAIDGVFQSLRTIVFEHPSVISLAAPFTGGNRQLVGDLCEVIIYNRILTQTERQKVSDYLSSKWEITIPPEEP